MDDNSKQSNFKHSEPVGGAEEYYANHLQVFWSGIDLTLVFGKLLHSSEDIAAHVLTIENRAKITMPWSLAKMIATTLTESVAKYETLNGEVKLPGQYKIP